MLSKIYLCVILVSCNILTTAHTANVTSSSGSCTLPPYPKHGAYVVIDPPGALPGTDVYSFSVNLNCDVGYGLLGDINFQCSGGLETGDFPECLPFCEIGQETQVVSCGANPEGAGETKCLLTGVSDSRTQSRANVNVYDGCGDIHLEIADIIFGGRSAARDELPWHAGIYTKSKSPYMQICGGSLISSTVVISAAHCFWNDATKQQPASKFAVAVGKLYRSWNDRVDSDAQRRDVKEIKIPPRFQGSATNFQDDIALVVVETAFQFLSGINPVCLNFDYGFDSRQLHEQNFGKVAGWGLTAENGPASPLLKVTEMPYVDIDRCISEAPVGFKPYITSDKICAGCTNGTAVCKGDSGGGLAFPYAIRGATRYFLHGVVSTAPKNNNECNIYTWATFTHVIRHEHFIKSVQSVDAPRDNFYEPEL